MKGDNHARAIDTVPAVNEHPTAFRCVDDFENALNVRIIRAAPDRQGDVEVVEP